MNLKWFAVPALALALGASSNLVTPAAFAAPQGPPPPGYQEGPWDAPPNEFRDIQRRGFHDGVEGARKDFNNHRRPDVDNREEFRHPHVERAAREDYREGYRRGYERAMQHMMNDHDRDHDRDHDHN